MQRIHRLLPRDAYLSKALMFRDTDIIKVVTGIRRAGKSSLLELIRQQIQSEGVAERSFVSINLESRTCPVTSESDLYGYCKARMAETGRTYLFIDEPQRLAGWQDAVNALRVDFDCDIYVTGSNSYLLSSELSTFLSGRYVEIEMLPLSVPEYVRFCGLVFNADNPVAIAEDGSVVLFDAVLERYLRFGGMPAIASLETTQAAHEAYLSGVYEAVVVRDILNRERRQGKSRVTDAAQLKRLTEYLAGEIGNLCSANGIANALTSAGKKTSQVTISSYLDALRDAYVFYEAKRYDLHGKETLRSLPKYYVADLGLRSMLMGYRLLDVGRAFENAVYLHLRYAGWAVHVGKLYQREVDFVAIQDGRRVYLQVADNLYAGETLERELAPLRSIHDAFPKMVVVRQGSYDSDIDGIQILGAQRFFLGRW